MKTVFELSQIYLIDKSYPVRKTDMHIIGLFSTLDNALSELNRYIKREKYEGNKESHEYNSKCFGYYIKEKRLNNEAYNFNVSLRSYTKDGVLNDECLLDELEEKPFKGRPQEKIRFKVGDIVEAHFGTFSELNIVAVLPPSIEEFEERKRKDPEYWMDTSDDNYIVYSLGEGDTHSHVECPYVFAPTRKVSKQLERKLAEKLTEII